MLKGFDTIKKSRSDRRGGGVAILVRRNIRYKIVDVKINCNDKLEVCAISIFINNLEMVLVALYRPPVPKTRSV